MKTRARSFGRKSGWLLCLVTAAMLLCLCGAAAEEVTLKYSYGDDAFYKHMLDVKNTTAYKGETWVFEWDSLSFEGAFSGTGGNTGSVWGVTAPQGFADGIAPGAKALLGTVKIEQPKPMKVYAFSGDRESGSYTLVDAQENVTGYQLELYSSHDETGALRVTDMVFLYCFRENGDGDNKYLAAAVYIDYEGRAAAPADRSPVQAAVVRADAQAQSTQEETNIPAGDAEAYAAMVRILDEERKLLMAQVESLEAELETLKQNGAGSADGASSDAQMLLLEAEKNLLTTQLAAKDTEIAGLKTQVETLQTENADLTQQVADLTATVNALNAQLAAAQAATPAPAPVVTATPVPTVSVQALIPSVLTAEDYAYAETAAAAYLLADGEAYDVSKTLRGVVTQINTPWSESYQNISVTIVCADAVDVPILCYRLKGDGAQEIKVGDIITVEGILKNYKGTIEFDSGCQLIGYEQRSSVQQTPAAAETPVITAAPVVTATPAPVITATPVPAPMETETPAPATALEPAKAAVIDALSGTWMANAKRVEGNSTRYFYRFLMFRQDGTCDWFDTDAMSAQETVEWSVMGDMLIVYHNGASIVFEMIRENDVLQLKYTPDGTVLKNSKYNPAPTDTPAPTATPAPIDVTFKKGQSVEIFNREGVKISFTGTVEDEGMSSMQLHVIVENQTSNTIRIGYSGTCNGWALSNCVVSGNASNAAPNAKAEGFIWLQYEDLHVSKFSDLTEGMFTFTVRNADSYTELFKVPNVHITFGTGEPGVIEPTYFEYYPELPDPTAYGAMYQSGRSGPTLINGVPSSSVTYKYRSFRSDELAAAFDSYIAAIKNMGFSVSKSGTQYTISHKGKKIALASCSDIIKIEILANAIVLEDETTAEDVVDTVKKNLGDTLSASMMTFKTEKTGKADKIYSYDGAEPRYWFYYEAEKGSTFVYLKGTFTNKTNGEVDIRNVYTNLLINGENNYKGNVIALRSDGENFLNYLAAQQKATVYVYFEVPDSVANSMKTAVVKLGFTQNFNTKVSTAGSGVYDFSKCSDVFEVDLMKKASSTKTTSTSGKDSKLKITKQPESVSIAEGEKAKFTVKATGDGLTYQWYYKGPTGKEYKKCKGTEATYNLTATEARDGRMLYCEITDKYGNTLKTDVITLTVLKAQEPITFQGIAWGSKPDTARTALVEAGYIKSKSAVASFHDVSSGMLTTDGSNGAYELPYGYEKVLYEDWIYGSDIKKTVGGYDVTNISMLYIYGQKDGKVNKDSKKLISVNVELSGGSMNDLSAKMTELYGECTSKGFGYYLWRGGEDTCVVLYDFAGPTLLYGTWDNLSQVKELYSDLGYEPSADDFGGL